jgi:tetratricopeptide (TPR) repeat protein
MSPAVRRGAAFACALALALWTAAGLRSFLPVGRQGFALANVDAGEALLHAVSPQDVTDRMPMEPLLEALCFVHASPAAMRFCVAAFIIAATLLVFALGGLLGSLWGGLLAAALWEKHFRSLGVDTGFYKYFFYMPFVLTALGLMIWRARKPTPWRTCLLAIAVGASLMYRSPLVFFPAFLALWELLAARRRRSSMDWLNALILCAAPLLFLLPWTLMNWRLRREFVPLERGAADINMVLGALGIVQGGHAPGLEVANALSGGRTGSVLGWCLQEISRHPFRYARGVGQRLLLVLRLFNVWALPAVYALYSFRKKEEFRQAGLFLLYFIGIHCLMAVSADYFEPLWPLIFALAAAPFARRWSGKDYAGQSAARRLPERFLFLSLAAISALWLLTARAVDSYAARAAAVPLSSPAALERELTRDPGDAWLLFDRGTRRLDRDDVGGALSDLGRSLALQPDVPRMKLQFDWAVARREAPSALLADPYCDDAGRPAFGDQLGEKACVYQALAYLRLGRAADAHARLIQALVRRRGSRSLLDPAGPSGERIQEVLRRAGEASFAKSLSFLAPSDRFLILDALPPQASPTSDDWHGLARESLAAGKPDLASKALRRSNNADPGLWIDIAESDLNAGRTRPAVEAAARAAAPASERPEDSLRLASLERRLHRDANALRRLRLLTARRPDFGAAWLELADAALDSGDRALASASAAQAESLPLDDGASRHLLGLIRRLAPPTDRGVSIARAAAYRRRRQFATALEMLGTLAADAPGSFDVWIERAETAADAGDRALASSSLARARPLARDRGQRLRLSISEQRAGDYAGALRILEDLSRESPRDATLMMNLGVCQYLSGRPERSAETLEAAIRLDPRLLPAYVSLASIYASLKRLDDARRIDDLALAVDTNDAALRKRIREDRAALENNSSR